MVFLKGGMFQAGGGIVDQSLESSERRRVRRLSYYICAMVFMIFIAALEQHDAGTSRAVGTVTTMAVVTVIGTLHAEPFQASVEEWPPMFLQVFFATMPIVMHAVILRYEDVLPLLHRLVTLFLLPLASVQMSSRLHTALAYLLSHFLLATFQFKHDLWHVGWQWLTVIFLYYCILADVSTLRSVDFRTRRELSSMLNAFRVLLSLVCDGYMVLDDTGAIWCMDLNMEHLLGLPRAAQGSSYNFKSFLDEATSQGTREAHAFAGDVLTERLQTLHLRTCSRKRLQVLAYTVPCIWSDVLCPWLPFLFGRVMPEVAAERLEQRYGRKLYIRAFRVVEHSGSQVREKADVRTRPLVQANDSKSEHRPIEIEEEKEREEKQKADTGALGHRVGGARAFESMAKSGSSSSSLPWEGTSDVNTLRRTVSGDGVIDGAGCRPSGLIDGDQGVHSSAASGHVSVALVEHCGGSTDKPLYRSRSSNRRGGFPARPWRSMPQVCAAKSAYTKVRTIAMGSQGLVSEVVRRDGLHFAMKEVLLPGVLWKRDFPKLLQSVDREVRALQTMKWARHVVVQLVDCWIEPDFRSANIVMEYLPFSLRTVLEERRASGRGAPLVEESTRWITQISLGLAAIHKSGYIHRDIKPSNLLLTKNQRHCKIADLGVSRPLRNSRGRGNKAPAPSDIDSQSCNEASSREAPEELSYIGTDVTVLSRMTVATESSSILTSFTQRPGTKQYTSPEALRGGDYDAKIDMFALGYVICELLTLVSVSNLKQGEPATTMEGGESVTLAMRVEFAIASAKVQLRSLPRDRETLDMLRDLCCDLLESSPQLRPTAREVLSIEAFKVHLLETFRESPELSLLLGDGGRANVRTARKPPL